LGKIQKREPRMKPKLTAVNWFCKLHTSGGARTFDAARIWPRIPQTLDGGKGRRPTDHKVLEIA